MPDPSTIKHYVAKAADGDVPAINSLADRTDGKVTQALIGDSEARLSSSGLRLDNLSNGFTRSPSESCPRHLRRQGVGQSAMPLKAEEIQRHRDHQREPGRAV